MAEASAQYRQGEEGAEGTADDYVEARGEVGLLDLGVAFAENLRLLVFGPLLAGIIAFGVVSISAPIFTARTSFIPPQGQQSSASAAVAQLSALTGLVAAGGGLKNPADQFVALTKSVTVAERLIDRFNLVQRYKVPLREDARQQLAARTKITSGREGLIVVEVDDESPKVAAEIANAYVEELQGLLGSLALTEAQQRRAFFEKQLEQTKARLTAAEIALGTAGVGAGAIKADPKAAVETVARLQARATVLEVRLAAMRSYLTESAPEFQQAQTELAAVRAQLEKSATRGGAASPQTGSYIERYRDFRYQETLFELFARQFELAKADEAKEGAMVQVIDAAAPPERKSKPKRALVAVVTTLCVFMVLLLWVFARSVLASTAIRPEAGHKLAIIGNAFYRLFMLRSRS